MQLAQLPNLATKFEELKLILDLRTRANPHTYLGEVIRTAIDAKKISNGQILINEDRTACNLFYMSYAFADIAGQLENESWLKAVLRSCEDEKGSVEYGSLASDRVDQDPSEKWVKFSIENLLIVREVSGRYMEDVSATKKEVFLIPQKFARRLKESLPAVNILGMGSVLGAEFLEEVTRTAKMEYLLKDVLRSLKEMRYEILFDIAIAEFSRENIMGKADIVNKKIWLAKKTFDMGRREIAMTLIEENEHISSGHEDETRQFQTHIFSQWLKTMEDNASLFL